jgi:hypothetical protein
VIQVSVDGQVVELAAEQYTRADFVCTFVERSYLLAELRAGMLEVCTHVDFLQLAVVEPVVCVPLAAQ